MIDVYMIWAIEPNSFNDGPWLVDAWDEHSVDGNSSGWDEAKKKAYDEHGAENIRIAKTRVDWNAVAATFQVPTVASGDVR